MKPQRLCLAACVAVLAQSTSADVRSLTSSELTETYIKDSTIIVTPAQKEREERARKVVTYTIAPGEPVQTEAEQQAELVQQRDIRRTTTDIAEESARQVVEELAFIERGQVSIAPLTERQINVPGYPNLQVPEGAFANLQQVQEVFGNELGIASDGRQFTFSIGNLPGVDAMHVERIRSDSVNLMPRPDGGFDLSIRIPQQ